MDSKIKKEANEEEWQMEQIVFDLSKRLGSFKPMNATNGGPRHRRHTAEMQISNFEDYKKARIVGRN